MALTLMKHPLKREEEEREKVKHGGTVLAPDSRGYRVTPRGFTSVVAV